MSTDVPMNVRTSALYLAIQRTYYRVQPIRAEASTAQHTFRLEKADGTRYDVASLPYGNQCDCPDYVFRRDGIDPAGCKHVRALVAEGLIEPARGSEDEAFQVRRSTTPAKISRRAPRDPVLIGSP